MWTNVQLKPMSMCEDETGHELHRFDPIVRLSVRLPGQMPTIMTVNHRQPIVPPSNVIVSPVPHLENFPFFEITSSPTPLPLVIPG
jgi:hypothetical protein